MITEKDFNECRYLLGHGWRMGDIASKLGWMEKQARQAIAIHTLPLIVQSKYIDLMRGNTTSVTWQMLPKLERLWRLGQPGVCKLSLKLQIEYRCLIQGWATLVTWDQLDETPKNDHTFGEYI